MSDRYCLVRDGSGHWYLCPVPRREEADAAVAAVERYWAAADYSEPAPKVPDWLERIDGPLTLTFTDPKTEG